MATAISSMALLLPGSSSTPESSPSKLRECVQAAEAIKTCLEKDMTPRKFLTRAFVEKTIVMIMSLVGSTNAILNLVAMAITSSVPVSLHDFKQLSDEISFLIDLAHCNVYYYYIEPGT